uniref:Uncharacterized protein n=1 Tax=Vespula pensylvanica TaxID=30213 RepID=A0A834NJX8_VESPE|nr:hypothetical protein H0235_013191 [Vespula pensylvanica]
MKCISKRSTVNIRACCEFSSFYLILELRAIKFHQRSPPYDQPANEKVWQTQIQRLSETVMKISRLLVPVNATISRSGSFVEIPTCQHVINRVWPINEYLSYATSSSNYNRVDSATMSKNRQNSEFSDR